MPQVVPAKVLDARTLQGIAPRPRVHLTNGSALVGEHAIRMLALLFVELSFPKTRSP